jgi:N-acetylglutamate synthase-like GNAT family acetyltransferase
MLWPYQSSALALGMKSSSRSWRGIIPTSTSTGEGSGSTLLREMESWMRAKDIDEVWVLAENEAAVEFYRARGFMAEQPQPVYMVRNMAVYSG